MVISAQVSESGLCVHIFGEDCVLYVCDVMYAVLYVRVNYFVMRGCTVSRRYIHVFNNNVFGVRNIYLEHLKLYRVYINGPSYVCCSECYVVSNECDEPTS